MALGSFLSTLAKEAIVCCCSSWSLGGNGWEIVLRGVKTTIMRRIYHKFRPTTTNTIYDIYDYTISMDTDTLYAIYYAVYLYELVLYVDLWQNNTIRFWYSIGLVTICGVRRELHTTFTDTTEIIGLHL